VERVGEERVRIDVPSIAPGGERVVAYALPTARRGVYPVGPLTIGHADPLRLMRVARSYTSSASMWVHPSVHQLPPMPVGRSRDLDGATSDHAPHGGVAFHSLREYVPGDDRRLIHWRTSARTERLMVRHHVIPNEPRLEIVLDTSADAFAHPEAFEDAVRVAASVAHSAWVRNRPVVLRTTGGLTANARKHGAPFRDLLDALARVTTGQSDPGLQGLLRLTVPEQGASLTVVSGRPQAEQAWTLRRLRTRYQGVNLVCVGAEPDRVPEVPGVRTITLSDSSELVEAWNRAARR
jgi:uncharacterized protein (DUF58 family)